MFKQAKQAVLGAARALTVHRRWRDSAWRRNRLLILCYHGISLDDEHAWDRSLYMEPARLRRRLEMLRQGNYNVLPLGEACERLRRGTLPPRAVTITFDDGDYDFASVAWPMLREFGYPATVYATTFYVDHAKPIFRLFCSYLLWKTQRTGTVEVTADLRLHLDAGHDAVLGEVERYAAERGLPLAGRDELAERLAGALGLDYRSLLNKRILQLMRPEEMARVSAGGADVQLHTHRHRTPRDRTLFLREIDDNRRRLREITGKSAEHFCYPSGVTHPDFLPWLQEREIRTATTCVPGLAGRTDDPLLLPRVVDHCNLSEVEIESWMAGVSHYLARRH